MTTPVIASFPSPLPSLGQDPQSFDQNVEGYYAHLPVFMDQVNVSVSFVNDQMDVVAGHAATALQHRNDAQAAVAEAQTAVTHAQEEVVLAQNAAEAAEQSAINAGFGPDAAASAEAAAQSASDAAASLASLLERYLGEHADDAAANAAAGTPQVGQIYYRTGDALRLYDGASWIVTVMDANGALLAAENLADLTDPFAAQANLQLSGFGIAGYLKHGGV